MPALPCSSISGFPSRKPDHVRRTVLRLHEQHPQWSHRQLAPVFNLRYAASTGISVGRTWVRNLLKQHAYQALQKQKGLKHRVPDHEPNNRTWGIDTTGITDNLGVTHVVLGVVDYGSRMNCALRRLRRFNACSLLGALLLAFGEYGLPDRIRLDNHPVHHTLWLRRILGGMDVRLVFTALASPWQNGRIERLFGTLKALLQGFAMHEARHMDRSLDQFRFWYNTVRPHQHLNGCTPLQIWLGVDPYRQKPRQMQWFEAWDGRLRGWVLRH